MKLKGDVMRFKKGQIVPRWTGIKASDRKVQHKLKFGADVSFEGGVFYLEGGGSCFMISNVFRRMKNGTLKRCVVQVDKIHINSERVEPIYNCAFEIAV